MIVRTTRISRKGGVRYIARHLLDKADENERIEVLAGDRHALLDAHALAKVKGCTYSVRHLSISPEREMSPAQLAVFLRSIDAEFRVGPDRPRLLVRHIKKGRSHFHLAIAEVDPHTLRVLDCRNDYARLEDLARSYERDHGETIQPVRAERRARKPEGFSDVARKKAERTATGFDKTRLRQAFVSGATAFDVELKRQGLQIADGDKGPILTDLSGTFVAAANRAAGVSRREFLEFTKGPTHDGNNFRVPANTDVGRAQHRTALAASIPVGEPGGAGPYRAAARTARADAGDATTTGSDPADCRRPHRPSVATLNPPVPHEILFLRRLGEVDLDALLRRARTLAEWMMSAFESEIERLSKQIRTRRERHVPADVTRRTVPAYSYTRRMTP
ncbi:hypothetical protein FHS25_000036 [Rhizobium laguerreae]|uniref:MobA/VirD2-like nuclease domain-containing protein n=1 Tax=Rhizobium laguerreae TaxID=1076926 RepID=A0ABR6G008_9HYPH|nr:relaxase/mobilization nuclease domain-containing protein [Rhizobium laguerreae]MBB3159604.1 hypothetical protein [Rhizobium laguerreae]OOO47754.1 hypothetical protein BS630_15870 [Rhizobium laguerreae]